MRMQIEARELTDREIRPYWFNLPICTEQIEELMEIEVNTNYYYINGKKQLKHEKIKIVLETYSYLYPTRSYK